MHVLQGIFVERAADSHVALRTSLLTGRPLPPPATLPVRIESRDLTSAVDEARLSLSEKGLASLLFDEPLDDEAFLRFGRALGVPIPEMDPAVQPYVTEGVLLNLRTDYAATREVSLQPFASNYLTLHSESSARPAAEQPRYIVLMCCEPGDHASSAQTVLVEMERVAARVPASMRELLACTRYARSEQGPNVVRALDGRTVFSFRDFERNSLSWLHTGTETRPEAINHALRSLLTAMYDPEGSRGVHWQRGLLVVIDNTYFFHGKTRGLAHAGPSRRHLKRLRLR